MHACMHAPAVKCGMQRCQPLFLGTYAMRHAYMYLQHLGSKCMAGWGNRSMQCAYCKQWFPNNNPWWGREDDSGYWYWRWGPPRVHLHDNWTPSMGPVGWVEHTWVWRRWHGWWYCNWCWNNWQRWVDSVWADWRHYCVLMARGIAAASAFPCHALPPPPAPPPP